MAVNQEGDAGRRIFPITPTQERASAPVLPRPGERPTPVSPEPGRHPEEKTPSSKRALIARLAGSLLALTGIAGPAVDHHIDYESEVTPSAIGRDIASVPGFYWNLGKGTAEDIQGLLKGPTIEEKFPIPLSKDSFTPVPKEEEQELWENTQTLDLENHIFVTGFPFDQETVDSSPNLRMNEKFNALLPPYIDAEKLKQEGIKNVTYFTGLSNGDEYRLVYDMSKYDASVILLWKAGITRGTEANSYIPAYTFYRVILRDKSTGDVISKSIAGLYAEPLIQTSPLPEDHGTVYEDGTPVQSGSSILRLTTDLQDWDGNNQTIMGERGQFVVSSSYMQQDPWAPIPMSVNFLLAPDGNIAFTEQN